MKNYTPIDRILLNVPKPIRENAEDIDLLGYALDAYNLLDITDRNEEVLKIIKVDNYKAKIPSDANEIHLVTYFASSDDLLEPDCSPSSIDELTKMSSQVSMEIFVESTLYQSKFFPLKFKGNSSRICCTCPSLQGSCPQYFSIDINKNIVTSFKEGYICLFYSRPIKDHEGNYLVYDYPEVISYLAYSAAFQHAQDRMWRHEEGAVGLYERYMDLVDTWWKKAKGVIRLRNLDSNFIRSINFTNTPNQRLMRLPLSYMEVNRAPGIPGARPMSNGVPSAPPKITSADVINNITNITNNTTTISELSSNGPYFDNDDAIANGLSVNDTYFLAKINGYSLPEGTILKVI
jgi:hypothetical protein